jgi:hypothetical protein
VIHPTFGNARLRYRERVAKLVGCNGSAEIRDFDDVAAVVAAKELAQASRCSRGGRHEHY